VGAESKELGQTMSFRKSLKNKEVLL